MNSIFEIAIESLIGAWLVCLFAKMLFGIDVPTYIKKFLDKIFGHVDDD